MQKISSTVLLLNHPGVFSFVSIYSILQFQPNLYHMRVSIFGVVWLAPTLQRFRALKSVLFLSVYYFRTAFKISLPPVLKAKKKKLKMSS